MMRDYMKALCCRFETTSRRAEYLDRKVERTYRQLTRLLDKPERRVVPLSADYTCFDIPDRFVVGYGLDYDQHYRNLPYIGVLKPSVYEK